MLRNPDSGDAANLEGGIAILRVVEALRLENFLDIALVETNKGMPGADITCEKEGQKICLEVKAITKQSLGRAGLFLEDQLYEKILENLPKARMQLDATASELQCSLKFFTCVLNWFNQSIYLGQSQYQQIVDRLERDGNQESLKGVDGSGGRVFQRPIRPQPVGAGVPPGTDQEFRLVDGHVAEPREDRRAQAQAEN